MQKARTPIWDANGKIGPRPPPDPNRLVKRGSARSRLTPLSPAELNRVQERALTLSRSESLNDGTRG